MRSFVDGKNRLRGTSQVDALMEASSRKKCKVMLKIIDVVLSFLLRLLMCQGGMVAQSFLARRQKQLCSGDGGSCC